ncbi:MAG: Histidine kinase protein, partial [Anaerolineales bacterium]|nr:Histidine kinase protein [Anaerolineales bacterium]
DLVERYGGRLSVQSRLNEGTTFTVVLPLAG